MSASLMSPTRSCWILVPYALCPAYLAKGHDSHLSIITSAA